MGNFSLCERITRLEMKKSERERERELSVEETERDEIDECRGFTYLLSLSVTATKANGEA